MRFEVLGPLRAYDGGRELDLGFPQQRALLALLLVRAGRPVPAAEIVGVLWPEGPPASAPNVVRRYLGALRRLLEPGLPPRAPGRRLVRQPGGHLLQTADDEVDLARFRTLTRNGERAAATGRPETALRHFTEALDDWRGPVASGIPAAVREHAVFAAVERELVRTTLMAADAALLCGSPEPVLPRLRRAAELDPLNEPLHARLVMVLAAAGLQAEALAVHEDVRRLLARELGVPPGAELAAAHTRVLRQQVRPARPVPRGERVPVPRPAQLPPGLQVFAGRRAELDALREIAGTTAGAPATVLIGGMPGIGKTALAVHWAHEIADRFPDGQLHVGLRGFAPSGAPLAPADALRAMLDALGIPPGRMPTGPDALAGLYRSLLAGRRLLVLLDDALDAEQVRPLLPASPGCLTLVTSRNGLPGLVAAGARPLHLDLPSAVDARTLLALRTGPGRVAAEPAAADEIVALCARLPLALALVAARAAAHPDVPLAAVAAALRRSRHSLDAFTEPGATPAMTADGTTAVTANLTTDVRTAFARSYRRLPPEHARLFRLLAPHTTATITAAVTAQDAAALAALPLRTARLILSDLADAHLVTEPAPGRYALHELMRVFATELGTA